MPFRVGAAEDASADGAGYQKTDKESFMNSKENRGLAKAFCGIQTAEERGKVVKPLDADLSRSVEFVGFGAVERVGAAAAAFVAARLERVRCQAVLDGLRKKVDGVFDAISVKAGGIVETRSVYNDERARVDSEETARASALSRKAALKERYDAYIHAKKTGAFVEGLGSVPVDPETVKIPEVHEIPQAVDDAYMVDLSAVVDAGCGNLDCLLGISDAARAVSDARANESRACEEFIDALKVLRDRAERERATLEAAQAEQKRRNEQLLEAARLERERADAEIERLSNLG